MSDQPSSPAAICQTWPSSPAAILSDQAVIAGGHFVRPGRHRRRPFCQTRPPTTEARHSLPMYDCCRPRPRAVTLGPQPNLGVPAASRRFVRSCVSVRTTFFSNRRETRGRRFQRDVRTAHKQANGDSTPTKRSGGNSRAQEGLKSNRKPTPKKYIRLFLSHAARCAGRTCRFEARFIA